MSFISGPNKMSVVSSESKKMGVSHSIHARFDIGKVLGTGGYATVREATSKTDQSVVALKMMNREHLDSNTEKNIRSEVSLLQSLNHPNIVRGYDFFEEPHQFYFVMEKIDGGELFDRIVKKTHYTEKEARDLVRILLNGVKYCHDRNIAHRLVGSEKRAPLRFFTHDLCILF